MRFDKNHIIEKQSLDQEVKEDSIDEITTLEKSIQVSEELQESSKSSADDNSSFNSYNSQESNSVSYAVADTSLQNANIYQDQNSLSKLEDQTRLTGAEKKYLGSHNVEHNTKNYMQQR